MTWILQVGAKCNHTSPYKNQAERDTHRREAEMGVVQPRVKGEHWKMGQERDGCSLRASGGGTALLTL